MPRSMRTGPDRAGDVHDVARGERRVLESALEFLAVDAQHDRVVAAGSRARDGDHITSELGEAFDFADDLLQPRSAAQ
jgi:hypothetical protein